VIYKKKKRSSLEVLIGGQGSPKNQYISPLRSDDKTCVPHREKKLWESPSQGPEKKTACSKNQIGTGIRVHRRIAPGNIWNFFHETLLHNLRAAITGC
jgi:hypothetical protein